MFSPRLRILCLFFFALLLAACHIFQVVRVLIRVAIDVVLYGDFVHPCANKVRDADFPTSFFITISPFYVCFCIRVSKNYCRLRCYVLWRVFFCILCLVSIFFGVLIGVWFSVICLICDVCISMVFGVSCFRRLFPPYCDSDILALAFWGWASILSY